MKLSEGHNRTYFSIIFLSTYALCQIFLHMQKKKKKKIFTEIFETK